eukprot:TRINITY_DN4845_c0_g1_i8.p1 TRINITY_DN4845_c0_g1~~TRINITY_DN4845_c0_g1_i8.p1  ORF type:complete len:327 (+),score=65.72 TRINITY_DN4845_c0_g1_i8:199-1179(+)
MVQRWYVEKRIATVVEDVARDPSFDWLRANIPIGTYDGRHDRQGRPVCYNRIGQIPFKEIVARGLVEKFQMFFVSSLERDLRLTWELSARLGKPIDTVLLIIDASGLGWSHISAIGAIMACMREMSQVVRLHYPDTVGNMVFINTPSVFDMFYSLVRPIMPDGLVAKQEVCGADFKPRLLALVAPENLPVEWGGTCSAPLREAANARGSGAGGLARTVTVSSSHEVVVDVEVPGSWILYEFQTAAHDIGFGLVYSATRETVVPLARFECAAQPHQGRVQTRRAGRYTALLDNSFSLLRSKTVTYQIVVMAPGSDAAAEAALQQAPA